MSRLRTFPQFPAVQRGKSSSGLYQPRFRVHELPATGARALRAEQALASTEGNHYTPPKGRLVLRQAIKNFYGTQFGKVLDPEMEVVMASGANQGKSLSSLHVGSGQ